MATEATAAGIAQAGKFLSFFLGEEEYGLAILKVQEIKGMMGITRLPRTPEYVRGLINLRGRMIPVVNLRAKLGLPATADTEKTCIIVVQVRHDGRDSTMGLVVDEVSEVLNLGEGQIEPPANFGGGNDEAGFRSGLGRLEHKVVILLDIDRVMSGSEIEAVIQAAG